MKILAFAYACEPDKGSEPGAGWCWTSMLAGFGDLWVITRANNRITIEASLPHWPQLQHVHFVYFDPPRSLTFWKRGNRGVRLFYLIWLIGALRRAAKLHKREAFDIVWHLTLANAWLGSTACLVGPPFVYGPVGGGVSCPQKLLCSLGFKGLVSETIRALTKGFCRYLNPLARLSWRRAIFILCQNQDTIDWMPRKYGSKAVVFPNAILQDADDCITHDGVDHGGTAVFAGRLLPWKGVSLAIQAVARTPGWSLLICGEGPDESRLRKMVTTRSLDERVTFEGWKSRRDLLALMRDSGDVLLFPSMHEDAGLVVVEAMACGLPVICLDRGGPPILAGLAGCPVPSESRSAVVSGLADRLSGGNLPQRDVVRMQAASFTLEGRSAQLREIMGPILESYGN
jgi:glycosyltransferase involved in cell wall biosynthesis